MIMTVGRFGIRASLRPFAFEMRSNVEDPDRWLIEYAGGHPTASGQVVTERTAVQLSACYCAVDLISKSLATSPLGIFEKLPDDSRREIPDHPVAKVLKHPNEEMTALTLRETVQGHLLLWGNGYMEIERNGAGQVVALWPLRPDRTFPRRQQDGSLIYVARASGGQEVILQPEDVFHIMGYTYDGLRGLSPVALHRESMGLTMATMNYGARFFGNDARPGGVLETPNKLKKEARDRAREAWEQTHRGGDAAFRMAILSDGMTFKTIGMPNEDAQYLQTRVFQLSEIARLYHVPLHKLSELSHATFSNIEQQSIEYIQDAVMPWAHAWEEEIERKLLLPAERDRFYAEHNLDGQMRGDTESRYKAYDIAWKDGWLSADDILKRENMNPQPNGVGKTLWVPVTQQPAENALAAPEDEPEPGDGGDPGAGGAADEDPNYPNPKGKQEPTPAKQQKPAKPKPRQNDRAAARKELNRAGAQRIQIARAFALSLEVVGERLNRKEDATLTRAFERRDDRMRTEFFDGYRNYVVEAYEPILGRLFQSIEHLTAIKPAIPDDIRRSLVDKYIAGLAHRYVEAARAHITTADKIPSWCAGMEGRSHFEAMRAANAFALTIYRAGPVKEIAWVAPEDPQYCCTSCYPALTRTVAPGTEFFEGFAHPPLHTGCECQIVAVQS
jgi:HK97 family phage portal protein